MEAISSKIQLFLLNSTKSKKKEIKNIRHEYPHLGHGQLGAVTFGRQQSE